jgi:hypothetical protein
MVARVTRKEIAEYRAFARKGGTETSHLTDHQIARQIRMLKGGLHKPAKPEIEEILARAKKTESVFLQCRQGLLSDLTKALSDIEKMDQRSSNRPRTPSPSLVERKARRVCELREVLLAYPPSMLSPEGRQALECVDEYASLATKMVEKGGPKGARALASLSKRLASIVKELKMTLS